MKHTDQIEMPPAGMVALQPGDLVDRGSEGEFFVIRIAPDSAHLQGFGGKRINVSRYTEPSTIVGFDIVKLSEILNRTKGTKMKIEPGDSLGLGGARVIVFHVTETTAQVISEGRLETIEREQNEFLLLDKPRKSEEDRKAALENFLSQNNLNLETLTKNTEEYYMKKKASSKTSTKARGGLAAAAAEGNGTSTSTKKKTKGAPKAKTGRSAYTRELAADLEATIEDIHKKSKAKYPNSDLSTTTRLVTDERKRLEKEAKSAPKSETPAS